MEKEAASISPNSQEGPAPRLQGIAVSSHLRLLVGQQGDQTSQS